MYGQRARLGLIVPSSNTVCEPEMATLCPDGIATYSSRILFEPTIEGLRDMKNHVERASLELSSEGICHLIAFCCTVGSMIGGTDYYQGIIDLISEKSGVTAITTTTAVKAALTALGVRQVAVATPYTLEINQIEAALLQAMDFEVTGIKGYHENISPDQFKNEMIGCLDPEDAFNIGMQVNSDKNEAIFISCTNFRAIEIIERLEQESGKPVITSNQAAMWYALRCLGIKDTLIGYGRLFKIQRL
jgi:maleate cis-trans isomerase